MSADKTLAQRLQEADQTIGHLITVGERRTLHLLLTEAAEALTPQSVGSVLSIDGKHYLCGCTCSCVRELKSPGMCSNCAQGDHYI